MSGLRILVPVKRVLDYAVRPRVNRALTAVDVSGLRHSMNPFDELSVEEAVRIREKKRHPAGVEDICIFSAGPPKALDVIRTALAMGADRGIHVATTESQTLEPLTVAKMLATETGEQKSNLVILGKQSIDDDAGQTGGMLAGLLGWRQVTQVIGVEFAGDGGETVKVVREVDGGTETVEGVLPMVLTTDLRLNEPRYATLPNIMKAKKKPMVKKGLGDYGVGEDGGNRLKVLKVMEPPARKGGGLVDNVDGMVAKLKELGAI